MVENEFYRSLEPKHDLCDWKTLDLKSGSCHNVQNLTIRLFVISLQYILFSLFPIILLFVVFFMSVCSVYDGCMS